MSPEAQPAGSNARLNARDENRIWLLTGLGCLALLLFVRNPYVVLRPQFWQEDAFIFLVQQRTDGLAAIFRPYSGYLLLFPRLVAAGAALFPLKFAPHLYLLGAFAGWLWVGGLILTSSLFASARWKFFAALAWVAVPHGGEVFLILTNTQWALAVGLALLLAESSTASRGRITRPLFLVLASMTGPFCIFLAPLAAWRLWQGKRTRNSVDLTAVIVLSGAAIQFLAVVRSSIRLQESTSIDVGLLSLLLWIGIFPELFGTKAAFLSDIKLRLAGTLAGLLGLIWAMWTAIPGATVRRKLLLANGLILGSALLYVVATKGGAPVAFGAGQRYLFVPFALYVLTLISAWSYCPQENRTWLYALLLLTIIGFHSSEKFVAVRYRVADWSAASQLLHAGQAVEIQVGPFDDHVVIPPDRVPLANSKP